MATPIAKEDMSINTLHDKIFLMARQRRHESRVISQNKGVTLPFMHPRPGFTVMCGIPWSHAAQNIVIEILDGTIGAWRSRDGALYC